MNIEEIKNWFITPAHFKEKIRLLFSETILSNKTPQ
jgi:hypothetical protein